MIPILIISFCIGMIFGSFSTVLIERWHSGKGGIMLGRSECPHCNHILSTRDLFPLFSYLLHRGKCRHCQAPIALFYPIAEIVMGLIFLALTYAILDFEIVLLSIHGFLLLVFGFVTGVYILYDLRYMEIPDQIVVPAIILALALPFFFLIFTGQTEYTFHISLESRIMGALILYSFFYMQILLPGGYHLLKQRNWHHLGRLIIGFITFPIEILISVIKKDTKEEDIDIPTWIGGGDLRLALFIGLTLGTLHGVVAFAIAYVIGSIVGIALLIMNGLRGRKTNSQIPFGPFLGLGWILSILLYREIEILYATFFI